MWGNCYWWGNRYLGVGPLVWWIQLGFWGLILGGIFYLFSRLRNRPSDDLQKNQEPLMILKK